MVEQNLLERLESVVIRLETKGAPEVWGAEHIAEWLSLSESTIRKAVVVRPGFPKPISATGAKEGQKRWFADEVIDWARKNRGTLPVSRKPGRRREAA
ncbi:hypothetical protein [Crenobacter cavernae]|uniref:DNA-binding protein n=1 Tax=Crenobacter cavernae TaxID=2290923 RepID=A0ABY0FDN9_9NEIS|nr:hypothetical protein [Crenobacter cavernae]RXZ42652.1 hypothetical protein EBB06_12210 [Crenobacter cavernae]